MTSSLLLLDSASLYFRAFYGRRESEVGSTAAVRGFLDNISTLVSARKPSHLVACWDDDWRPAFRVDALPSYKAHRVAQPGEPGGEAEEVPDALAPQVPIIAAVLAAIGIARVGAAGYEADDVIASYAHQAHNTMPVDIVTGDRDLFQLVDDAARICVLYPVKGGVSDPALVNQSYLQENYGIASGDHYALMSILRGDPSDGLPGVAGIGEKGAAKLVSAFGSLDAIRAAAARTTPPLSARQAAAILAASDYLDAAPMVVRTATDVPLPQLDIALPKRIAEPAQLRALQSEHRLGSSVDRLLHALQL